MYKDEYYENLNLIQKRKDDGNEATGQTAAWMFAVANFSVLLSILIKLVTRFVPLTLHMNAQVTEFNHVQKKYLKKPMRTCDYCYAS